MKDLSIVLLEKLQIKSNSKNKNKEQLNFENLFNGVPEKILNKIYNNYLINVPDSFSKECKDAMICSAFELLFMMAACLVDDNLDMKYYNYLGTKYYKMKLNGKNNPYDYSWYEEEVEDNKDILEYFQQDWIPNNLNEFEEIYNICKQYKKVFTIENIWNVYDKVFDS